MAKVTVTFLGTGPTRGVKAKGKSGRLESSCLIETPLVNVLIDVTRDFKKQVKLLPATLDAVLITHAHKDAIGGLDNFIIWQARKGKVVPILSMGATLAKIKKSHRSHLDLLDLHEIKQNKKFQLGDLIITPFLVRHSIQPHFPTLGFHFSADGKKLTYVSDVGSFDRKAEKLMKSVDILILDGAMWGKKIKSHLDIKEILPKICKWQVSKIIFTQIGKTAPKYEVLKREIKKLCPKAIPAFDGMSIKI